MATQLKSKPSRLRLKKIIPWSWQRAPAHASPATPVGWTLVTPTPVTPVRVSQLLENVKFTSYGLPYPVEYANVTFKRGEDPPSPPPPKPYASPPPHSSPTPAAAPDWQLAGESAEVRAAYPPVQKSEATSQGVQIWYASQGTEPPKPMSPALLRDFISEIQKAVAKAGMQGAPSNDTSQANKGQMYRGTYKQVMEALSISGMNTAPCPPEGPVGATRLGNMIVANPTDDGRVEMNPVVLWA